MKNKYIFLFSIFFLIGTFYANDTKEEGVKKDVNDSIYIKVANLVLESEDHLKPTTSVVSTEKKDERNSQEKLKDSLKSLDDAYKKEILFNLFALYGGMCEQKVKIFEPYVLHELSVLCGSELSKKNNLYKQIDRTTTSFGSAVLSRMLAEPLKDIDVIKKRQNIVKLFREDKELFKRLNRQLTKIKKYENNTINFWNPHAEIDIKLLMRVYSYFLLGDDKVYDVKFINKSPKILQFLRLNFLSVVGLNSLITPILLVGSPLILEKGARNDKLPPGVGFTAGLLYDLFLGFSYKLFIDELKLQNQICYTIHKKMKSVAKTLKSIDKIHDLIQSKSNLSDELRTFNQISRFLDGAENISKDLLYLQNLLENDVFHTQVSWSSNMGKILAGYSYMRELKDHFIPVLEAIGEIDACLSIVKLMNEFEEKSVSYCYVDFKDSDFPYIELERVWNPLIDREKVITEDIIFGKPEFSHNIMLTGPHGGGKSTFMKSIAYSIILSQTFGIAPAQRGVMTVFDRINSYVNIKENLAAGQSTFMAEMDRVKEILGVLKKLESGQKSFTIMDEVFKGTMEDEGSRRLYNFGKEISNIQQNICIVATHFNKPADLEKDTNGEFTNYHVGLIEQEDHSWVRTFKLIKGKNEWWFNDPEKRERYIDWLTSFN